MKVASMHHRIRIAKLGGSLLSLPDLDVRLDRWLRKEDALASDEAPLPAPWRTIFIVGGGKLIDAMRELDAIHQLPSEELHWSCVELLSHTARLLFHMLPDSQWLGTAEELHAFIHPDRKAEQESGILDIAALYNPNDDSLGLPKDWQTTSDSISARIAGMLHATELVVFKSTDAPLGATADDLVQQEIVDEAFPQSIADLKAWRIVNLRQD